MFTDAGAVLDFIQGGNALLTITSVGTGKHFTFKIKQGWDHANNRRDETTPFFVSVLNGPDNSTDFMFIGLIPREGLPKLIAGRKGRPDAQSFKALDWVLRRLVAGEVPEEVTIQHEGKCCRCGRTLTHPNSIETGIGPECMKHFSLSR